MAPVCVVLFIQLAFMVFAQGIHFSPPYAPNIIVPIDPGETASRLRISFDKLDISPNIVYCGDERTRSIVQQKGTQRVCDVYVSACPLDMVASNQANNSDIITKVCMQLDRRMGDISSLRFEVPEGHPISYKKPKGLENKDDLLLAFGPDLTAYVKFGVVELLIVLYGWDQHHPPVSFLEFSAKLTKDENNRVHKAQTQFPKKVLQALELAHKLNPKKAVPPAAEVEISVSLECFPGYFPEHECTVYTGCKPSECVACNPLTGAQTCQHGAGCKVPPHTCQGNVVGGWSKWGAWQDCPMSCGWSIKARDRKCNHPPPAGTGQCTGSSIEVKTCRRKPCGQTRPQHSLTNHAIPHSSRFRRDTEQLERNLDQHKHRQQQHEAQRRGSHPHDHRHSKDREDNHHDNNHHEKRWREEHKENREERKEKFEEKHGKNKEERKEELKERHGKNKEERKEELKERHGKNREEKFEEGHSRNREEHDREEYEDQRNERRRHDLLRMEAWLKVKEDIKTTRQQLDQELRSVRREQFWARAAVALSAASFFIALLWTAVNCCRKSSRGDARADSPAQDVVSFSKLGVSRLTNALGSGNHKDRERLIQSCD